MKKIIFIFGIIFSFISSYPQEVLEHISNTGIYDFLDELATIKIITVNSVVKPYSRSFIAEKLTEAKMLENRLNKRQKKELEYYLNNFRLEWYKNKKMKNDIDLFRKDSSLSLSINPIGFSYKDKTFTLSIRPIYGIDLKYNKNGSIFHRWGGAEAYGYIGKHIAAYVSLRDNNLNNKKLISSNYLTKWGGVPYKNEKDTRGGIDYSETRGGIIISFKWGSLGLIKDHFIWGNNYNGSNIFSGRTPSFAHIRLQLRPVKWFEFNYVHGWLISEVTDSSRTYNYGNGTREIMRGKYLAANMFTIKPWKNLSFSFGNSIIYSDIGVQAVYLIPFLFYKSADHTYDPSSNSAGQNAQMFFDISSRQIKHLHLYSSLFIDEIGLSRMFDKQQQTNFLSIKAGFHLVDFPVQNLALTFEYTRTNPYTYQHFIPSTTFESNQYALGSYLRDNAQEIYCAIAASPIRGLKLNTSLTMAQKGNYYVYGSTSALGTPFMKDKTWSNFTFAFDVSYEIIYNCYVYLGYSYSDIKEYNVDGKLSGGFFLNRYTPEFYQGKNHTLTAGINVGF